MSRRPKAKPPQHYYELRDYEYSQFIHNLVYLSEIKALSGGNEISKYRNKSLSNAAHSIDGYSTQISEWIDGVLDESEMDYVPSLRIKKYLLEIRKTGNLGELEKLSSPNADGCLNLRSIPKIRKKQIASFYNQQENLILPFNEIASTCGISPKKVEKIFTGQFFGIWQKAHIFPPLFRFMKSFEDCFSIKLKWKIQGIKTKSSKIRKSPKVELDSMLFELTKDTIETALIKNKVFKLINYSDNEYKIKHFMGWFFTLSGTEKRGGSLLEKLIYRYDPMVKPIPEDIKSDLHMHTTWSDGLTPIENIGKNAISQGLDYIVVSDHSRSSKIQGGLTPSKWFKQRRAIFNSNYNEYILHGLEVDILADGNLDFPNGFLAGMDIVIASVHSGWSGNYLQNTNRIITAIESGNVDIIGHPTATITGKSGIPNYYRPPVNANWDKIFSVCAKWQVALEVNCFPSRLDLSYKNIELAAEKGCWISLGSDAHAKSHQELIKFGIEVINQYDNLQILNKLSIEEIKKWLKEARTKRKTISKRTSQQATQLDLFNIEKIETVNPQQIVASIENTNILLPSGSSVIGIDLTAGANKKSGVAYLSGNNVEATSLLKDEDILEYIHKKQPKFVSIDSPLGLPGGGETINPKAGIVRLAERDLSSVGIPAYPALIDSMKNLTLRGIALRKKIKNMPAAPTVIESYPGAAQDILGIPRKQNGLNHLRQGLVRLGLSGPGIQSESHDEIDAITCCVVGRFFESGNYEPMGIVSEAQLIVPKMSLLKTEIHPIISVTGMPGAGKSVVARYLSLFYGFEWIKTDELLKDLMRKDFDYIVSKNLKANPSGPFSNSDVNNFLLILSKNYNFEPISNLLKHMIKQKENPIVIDSLCFIDNFLDLKFTNKLQFNWHIFRSQKTESVKHDCVKFKIELLNDRKTFLKKQANVVIENNGTLENLHWAIDDALFMDVLKINRLF